MGNIQRSNKGLQFCDKTFRVEKFVFFPTSMQSINSHHITVLVIDAEFVVTPSLAAQGLVEI
jgi:hypothetical protein